MESGGNHAILNIAGKLQLGFHLGALLRAVLLICHIYLNIRRHLRERIGDLLDLILRGDV